MIIHLRGNYANFNLRQPQAKTGPLFFTSQALFYKAALFTKLAMAGPFYNTGLFLQSRPFFYKAGPFIYKAGLWRELLRNTRNFFLLERTREGQLALEFKTKLRTDHGSTHKSNFFLPLDNCVKFHYRSS